MNFSRALEGVGIALESVRSNKVRAALTILGRSEEHTSELQSPI